MSWDDRTEARLRSALARAADPRNPHDSLAARVEDGVRRHRRRRAAAVLAGAVVAGALATGIGVAALRATPHPPSAGPSATVAPTRATTSATAEDDGSGGWRRLQATLPHGREIAFTPRLQMHGSGRWELVTPERVVSLDGTLHRGVLGEASLLARDGSTTTVVVSPETTGVLSAQVVTPTSSTVTPLVDDAAAQAVAAGGGVDAMLDPTGRRFVVAVHGDGPATLRAGRVTDAPAGRTATVPNRTNRYPTWPLTALFPVVVLPTGDAVVQATYENPTFAGDAPPTESMEPDAVSVAYALTRAGARVLYRGSASRAGDAVLFTGGPGDADAGCVRSVPVPEAVDPKAVARARCTTPGDPAVPVRSPSGKHVAALETEVADDSGGRRDVVRVDGKVVLQVAAMGAERLVWEDDDHLLVAYAVDAVGIDGIRVDARTGAKERAPMPTGILQVMG